MQSLILITVVVSMVMAVIGNSLITAVGLMGARAIVRFRNMVKDTRDIAFVFCALVVGMATGAGRVEIAVLGTVVLCLIAVYLHWTDFGHVQPRHGFLRLRMSGPMREDHGVQDLLQQYCRQVMLISSQLADEDDDHEYAFQLWVKDALKNQRLVAALEDLVGVREVQLTMQEQLLEI